MVICENTCETTYLISTQDDIDQTWEKLFSEEFDLATQANSYLIPICKPMAMRGSPAVKIWLEENLDDENQTS